MDAGARGHAPPRSARPSRGGRCPGCVPPRGNKERRATGVCPTPRHNAGGRSRGLPDDPPLPRDRFASHTTPHGSASQRSENAIIPRMCARPPESLVLPNDHLAPGGIPNPPLGWPSCAEIVHARRRASGPRITRGTISRGLKEACGGSERAQRARGWWGRSLISL